MDRIHGITWGWGGRRGTWQTPEAVESMRKLADTGANWVTIAFAALQEHAQDTIVNYWDAPVVTDDEVRFAIDQAQQLGLKVCLKPVVNCKNGTWRAHINFFDQDIPGEPSWSQWFASYDRFILHYAEIAKETACDMFCVGCEMVQADKREADWRHLIKQVRETYQGLITYNCDKYQEEHVRFWDAVDMVSSSGYYPATEFATRVQELHAFANEINKPFFFMEIGCMSVKGASQRPNDWSHQGVVDLNEQADYYSLLFATLREESWFYGWMLWDWPTILYDLKDAAKGNYYFYGKPAELVVRQFYQGSR